MGNRNWGLITSGETFEALATTLIFFEDPKATLFGRRGKDGGQDARSGDGTRVFQAKHHEDGSADKAITDAKKEAAKIVEYRKPSHFRHEQWKGVTHWRLVANADFNPTDRQKWDSEVVPLFSSQGLIADYWERANLNALLDKHPEVDRSFFENETRALLSLPEAKERCRVEETFLRRTPLTAFFGRESDMAQVRKFLSSSYLFLVVHGAGGIGKTRFLIEAGEEIAAEGSWQVLWANVASMSSTGTWFDAIVPERATLLVVDEPESDDLLRVLSEQLGGRVGRVSKWKVAVAVRSPKDQVLRFLFTPKMKNRVQELPITALPIPMAEKMCEDLLSSGPLASTAIDWRKEVAQELARRFSQHPIWLTLAVYVLETHGDLAKVPQTADDLAADYLREIIELQQQASRDQVLALIRWIALIGAVNRQDDSTVKLLGQRSSIGDETAVRQMLLSLVERRALVQRGAKNRLVELKPDVLRDHVLLRWLSVDVGYGDAPVQPSEDARILVVSVRKAVLNGNLSSLDRTILPSLARTELILSQSGQPIPLLDPFFSGIQDGLNETTASARILIAQVLVDVAAFHPIETVELIRQLRSSVVEGEAVDAIFGNRELGQDDVVLELGWPLFHAAMGATTPTEREQVLEELCVLTELESGIAGRRTRGLPNDGKRAGQLVGRILQGGPQFSADFEDAAAAIALGLLDSFKKEPLTLENEAVLKALLEPAVALQRRQTWSENYNIHIQTYIVLPSHPAWNTREAILNRIKGLLADATMSPAKRVLLWALFAKAHGSANQCRGQVPAPLHDEMRQMLVNDLIWARSILVERQGEIEELAAARDLWNWHYEFETDPNLKRASDALEALYASNPLADEFGSLLGEDWKQRGSTAATKGRELALASTPEGISQFIDRAIRFLGKEEELHQLVGVAQSLGENARSSEAVRGFVRGFLANPTVSALTDFASTAAAGWVATERENEDAEKAYKLVVELLAICGSDDQRIGFLRRIYGIFPPPYKASQLSTAEHGYLRSLAPVFMARRQGPAFIQVVGWTFHYDWQALKILIEQTLDDISSDQMGAAINILVDSIYWTLRESDPATIPQGLTLWLLDQLLRTPDLEVPGGRLHWHVREILKVAGSAPLSWLPEALERRRDMEISGEREKVRAFSHQARLSHYVTPITTVTLNDPSVLNAVRDLVDLLLDQGTLSYYLPELLRDVDPEGLLIPTEVANRVAGEAKQDDLLRLSRIAGIYALGGNAWRTIAKPIILRAVRAPREEVRRSLFSSLIHRRFDFWSASHGEVPKIFVDAVEAARHLLESETDAEYVPFWEWNLAVAEARLRDEEEQAKEERGE